MPRGNARRAKSRRCRASQILHQGLVWSLSYALPNRYTLESERHALDSSSTARVRSYCVGEYETPLVLRDDVIYETTPRPRLVTFQCGMTTSARERRRDCASERASKFPLAVRRYKSGPTCIRDLSFAAEWTLFQRSVAVKARGGCQTL